MKVYYSHSMKIYGTEQEGRELQRLKGLFTSVINPNGDIIWNGTMDDYFEVIDTCQTLVFSIYKGFIGKGVYLEIKHAVSKSTPVFCIEGVKLFSFLGVEDFNEKDWAVRYTKPIIL